MNQDEIVINEKLADYMGMASTATKWIDENGDIVGMVKYLPNDEQIAQIQKWVDEGNLWWLDKESYGPGR